MQQQLQGTLGRTGLPWQPQHSLHQQPPTTAAPAALAPSTRPPPPVKPRQVSVLFRALGLSQQCSLQSFASLTVASSVCALAPLLLMSKYLRKHLKSTDPLGPLLKQQFEIFVSHKLMHYYNKL